MAVKLFAHGSTLAVPLPIQSVKRLKLKDGYSVTVLDEYQWLRIRPLSPASQPSLVAVEQSLRRENSMQDPDEPPRETPSTIGFFSTRKRK